MGKVSRWFRGLLGLKSADTGRSQTQKPPTKKKRSFAEEKDLQKQNQHAVVSGGDDDDNEARKHAIAIAAATAAVAEAAVAAAQAAAAVVQLTNSGRNISAAGNGCDVSAAACVRQSSIGYCRREKWAAVTVQSHFRAYLSRRALRALKALVKLQALVRGYLVRKQTAYALRRLQALVRVQVRAGAGRVQISEHPHSCMKSSQFNYAGPPTPEKSEHTVRARNMKHEQFMILRRNGSRSSGSVDRYTEKSHASRILMDNRMSGRMRKQGSFTGTLPAEDDKSDKFLEVDTGNPPVTSKHRTTSHLSLGSDQHCQSFTTSKDSTARQSVPSPSSGEARSLSTLKFARDVNESPFCSADNSPTYYSASSRGGSSMRRAFTPTKSDGSRTCLSGYPDHPNYMACTESSKAKVRSLSAPKQRPQFERSSSTKRDSVHGYGDSRPAQIFSALHANFTNKAYPGSGRLDRLGTPIRGDIARY